MEKSANLPKLIKKLLFTNRYVLSDISKMLGISIEECVSQYQSYFNVPIPPSLFIVGNQESRSKLRKCIETSKPCLLIGPNGVGKTCSTREVAKNLGLRLKRIFPLKQGEIVEEFGKGVFDPSNKNLYVIEADSLGNKKYSILVSYIKEAKRPIVFILQDKKKLNGNVVKLLQKIKFYPPTSKEVGIFLKEKFGYSGDIEKIYDPDMRVVLNRMFGDDSLKKFEAEKEIKSQDLTVELGMGFVKKEDFRKLKQPLWWVIRSLAFNQCLKFPRNKKLALENLEKLSYIDFVKFRGNEDVLHYMLMGLRKSSRRAFFKFPPWPKKKKKEESFEIFKKKPIQKKFDINKWL